MSQERRKGGRRRTDRRAADDDRPTLTNRRSGGSIEHDDRGDARWVWASEQQARESTEKTFDELKALDNETLTILEQSDPSRPKVPPGGGYNPYDVSAPQQKPSAKKRG
jgi:hypothetical protein